MSVAALVLKRVPPAELLHVLHGYLSTLLNHLGVSSAESNPLWLRLMATVVTALLCYFSAILQSLLGSDALP